MTESAGPLFERLLGIMARLRGPGGCPWDREQTPSSLKPYLLEAYEVLDALDARGEHLLEELGDLLFQVVFHSQIAAERDEFSMKDVLRRLNGKMVGRHPHVFGDAAVETPTEALAQWEVLKQREAEEAGRTRSVLDGVPRMLPALLRAQRTQAKAARVHFDWPDARAAWSKVEEEMQEAAAAVGSADRGRIKDELGDVLFSLVNVARLASVDAEDALTGTIEKFHRRVPHLEGRTSARGKARANRPQEGAEEAGAGADAQRTPGGGGRR